MAQAEQGAGWVEYDITNPTTGKVQTKMSYVCKQDGVYLGCGVYKSFVGDGAPQSQAQAVTPRQKLPSVALA